MERFDRSTAWAVLCAMAALGVSGAASAQVSTTYAYDVQGQVTQVARGGATTTTYGYDQAGNRTQVVTTAGQGLRVAQGAAAKTASVALAAPGPGAGDPALARVSATPLSGVATPVAPLQASPGQPPTSRSASAQADPASNP